MSGPRRYARTLDALRRFGPYLVAVVVAIGAIAGLMLHPSSVITKHRAGYVILAGSAGLRWDDVDPVNTPTLWKLAERGSIADLTVRSAAAPTCPSDGWVTLGAGRYAQRAFIESGGTSDPVVDGECPAMRPNLRTPDKAGAFLNDQLDVNQDEKNVANGAHPGALAETVRCTSAVGVGGAIAAARPYGQVDQYAPFLPADPGALLAECPLSIIDLGTVSGTDPTIRKAQAALVDHALGQVVAARPPNSLLLVAGLSDTDRNNRLHVAIADGAGFARGYLTSTGAGRAGYLRLVDLAPTAFAALGGKSLAKLFIGVPAQQAAGRSDDPLAAVTALSDADHEVDTQRGVGAYFFWILVFLEAALVVGAIPLLKRARRSLEPHGVPRYATGPPSPVSPRVVRWMEAGLVAVSLFIAGALLADAVPWWRAGQPGLVFAAVGLAVVAAMTALAFAPRTPWRAGALGPIAFVCGVSALTVTADVMTGSRLQLNGVAGYSAANGVRAAGLGPIGLGVLIVGVLLGAGCAAQWTPPRSWRPSVVGVVAALGVIVVGSPVLGADPGGAVALTAGGCIAAAIASGGWLSFGRFAWALLAGLAVLVGFATLDVQRPLGERSAVGQFLTQLHNGTAGTAVRIPAASDVTSTFGSPLSLIALIAVLFNILVLIRPWGGLLRLFGLYPAVRGALTGIAVAATIGGLLDGNGLVTAGAAAAVALPLVTLAAMRVLDHADDRTVSRAESVDSDPPPAPVGPAGSGSRTAGRTGS